MRDFVELLFRIEQSRWAWRLVSLVGSVLFMIAYDASEMGQAPHWRLGALNAAALLLIGAAWMGRGES